MERSSRGWVNGITGVVIFSGSLPATRVAVADLDPLFVTVARAAIAGTIAAALLAISRQRLPARADAFPLAIVASGVVAGFPLLTALALVHMTAAASVVFVGLLPLSTAMFGAMLGGERPHPRFWLFSALGAACVAGFAWSPGSLTDTIGDALMVAAILACGMGYAQGAILSRHLGSWQVICWALVLALPFAVGALACMPWPAASTVGTPAWIALGYVSVFSMLIGFVFWYRGLALGGIAAVGQLQLLQPFLGLVLAAAILHERVGPGMVASMLAVIGCVWGARRFGRTRKIASSPPAGR